MGPSVRWDHAMPEVSDGVRALHRWSSAKGGVVLGALEQNFKVLGWDVEGLSEIGEGLADIGTGVGAAYLRQRFSTPVGDAVSQAFHMMTPWPSSESISRKSRKVQSRIA